MKDHLTYCTHYDVSSTDKDTYCSDGFNAVIASTSSRNASATNRDRMQGTIHVTTAGTMVLRFATEGASAITITDLSGWYRNPGHVRADNSPLCPATTRATRRTSPARYWSVGNGALSVECRPAVHQDHGHVVPRIGHPNGGAARGGEDLDPLRSRPHADGPG